MESYLKWILAEKSQLMRESSKKRKIQREILKGVLGALMTWCHENSQEFRTNIDLFESKTIEETLKRMIHKVGEDEYVVRLFLKSKSGPGSIQTLYGLKHDIPAGFALLQLDNKLPKADRLQLRSYLKDCLNAEGVISPIRVKQWLIPVLKEFFEALDKSEINGYAVSAICGHHMDGFNVILGCCESGRKEPMTIKIKFEVALTATGWPKGLNLQHPLPRKQPYAQFGQKLLQSIREEFELGELSLVYTSRLVPAPKKLSESDIRRMSRAQKAKQEVQEADAKMKRRYWLVDTSDIDERLLSASLGYNGLGAITKAIVLYDVLLSCPNSPLPRLTLTVKRTLSLWLIKKQAQELQGLCEYFTAFCGLVLGMCRNNFCTSFCQPNYNLVAEKIKVSTEQCEKLATFIHYLKTDDVTMVKQCLGIDTPSRGETGGSHHTHDGIDDVTKVVYGEEYANEEADGKQKFTLPPSTLRQKSVVFDENEKEKETAKYNAGGGGGGGGSCSSGCKGENSFLRTPPPSTLN